LRSSDAFSESVVSPSTITVCPHAGHLTDEATTMHYDDEIGSLMELYSTDLGVTFKGWESEPLSITVEESWCVGDMIERFGHQSSFFEAMSPRHMIIAKSIDLPLNGTGSRFRDLLERDAEVSWTLPQAEVIEFMGNVMDTLLGHLSMDIDQLSTFRGNIYAPARIAVPQALQDLNVGIDTDGEWDDVIDIDHAFSHPACRDIHELIEPVNRGEIRICKLTFVVEDGDEDAFIIGDYVAWPVAEEEAFLVDLYHRLAGTATPATGEA
jgi:hypothetical protein